MAVPWSVWVCFNTETGRTGAWKGELHPFIRPGRVIARYAVAVHDPRSVSGSSPGDNQRPAGLGVQYGVCFIHSEKTYLPGGWLALTYKYLVTSTST